MLELCTTLCKHCRTSPAVQSVSPINWGVLGLIVLVFFRSSRPQLLLKCHLQYGQDVLVINRARLLSDTYFTTALNAMKHPNYPTLGQQSWRLWLPFYFQQNRDYSLKRWVLGHQKLSRRASQAQLHQPEARAGGTLGVTLGGTLGAMVPSPAPGSTCPMQRWQVTGQL